MSSKPARKKKKKNINKSKNKNKNKNVNKHDINMKPRTARKRIRTKYGKIKKN